MIDLAKVDKVNSMLGSHSFLVEEGDAIRRVEFEKIKQQLGLSQQVPQFTLEANGSSSVFSISSGRNAEDYRAAMGGYMLKVVGGKVYAAKLSPANWNYFSDGSKVDDASKYETMVHVPPCYFKAQDKTMQFGGLSPLAGGHAFDSPEWVGAYLMYVDGNGAGHSRPDVAPSHSRKMSAFQDCTQKLGSQWGQANYGFFCLINALYQASFGNLDSQSVIGSGWQHGNWEYCRDVAMGLTRKLGDATGCVLYNDDTVGNQYPTKLFCFEDLYSKLWEFRPGIRFYYDSSASQRYAVIYSGNQVSNSATGREVAIPLLGSSGHTAKTMLLGEHWDMLCTSFDSGTNGGDTYYCDGHWDGQGGELLFVGGGAYNWSQCGVACSGSFDGFSNSWAGVSARLAFWGTPIYVNGTELMAMQ